MPWRFLFRSAVLLTAVLFVSSPLRAETVDEAEWPEGWTVRSEREKKAPPKPRPKWYGWQVVLSDVAALLTVGFVGATRDDGTQTGIKISAAAVYLGGPPVIHLGNGQVRNSLLSLGARVLGLGMTMVLVAEAERGLNDDEGHTPGSESVAAWLSPIPIVSASVLDGAFLARKPVDKDDHRRKSSKRASRWSPSVLAGFAPQPGGGSIQLAGTF